MALELNKVYNEDCLTGMQKLDTDSIDAIVSDPPYQLTSIMKRFGKEGSAEAQYGEDGAFQRVSRGFMGKEWDVLPTKEILKEALRVLKPGAFALWLMTPRQDSQLEFLSRLREAGFVISFSPIYWTYASGFPKALNISKAVDKKLGFERETTGFDKKRSPEHNDYGVYNIEWERKDKPASPEAKALDGSYGGFQPKPAIEVIIVSMKPLSEKSYVDQALKNRKGITWLDDARIPFRQEDIPQGGYGAMGIGIGKPGEHQPYTPKKDRVIIHNAPVGTFAGGEQDRGSFKDYRENTKGRFPANLLVSDNILNVETDKSFSRYFSLDAWWEQKLKELPKTAQKIFPFLYVPKANKSERNKGLSNETIKRNIHPTVKPIKLMSYLITLTTREGDIVLDPFIGSGTTGISALLLNRKFIGFEREPDYFKIAQERIEYYQNQNNKLIRR